jgi:serine/threonine protein kinase HipA of HipAB toxin-antitoxin module
MSVEISRTPGSTLQPRIDPVFTLATVWYAPAVKRAVRWHLTTRAGALNILVDDTYELASYRPG